MFIAGSLKFLMNGEANIVYSAQEKTPIVSDGEQKSVIHSKFNRMQLHDASFLTDNRTWCADELILKNIETTQMTIEYRNPPVRTNNDQFGMWP